jgi:hypothetical protein
MVLWTGDSASPLPSVLCSSSSLVGRDGSGRLINDASPGRRVLDLVVQRSLRGRRRDAALPDGGVGDGGDRLLLVTGTAIEAAFPSVDVSVALMASCILMVL